MKAYLNANMPYFTAKKSYFLENWWKDAYSSIIRISSFRNSITLQFSKHPDHLNIQKDVSIHFRLLNWTFPNTDYQKEFIIKQMEIPTSQ